MTGEGIGTTVWTVLLLLLLFAAAYYTTRVVSIKAHKFGRGKYLRVIDRLVIGRDKHILLVEAADQIFVLGICNTTMTTLGTLPKEQLENFSLTEEPKSASVTSGFQGILNRISDFSKRDDRRRDSVVNWQKKRSPKLDEEEYDDSDEIDRMLQSMNERRDRVRNNSRQKGGRE